MNGVSGAGGPTMPLTIIAQDPSFRRGRQIVTAQVDVPRERLAPGPRGSRVHVIDFDSSTDVLYAPRPIAAARGYQDRYVDLRTTDRLLTDPGFHAQNVYAIVMATLASFEKALGRRISWAFPGGGHQIKVVPHAFRDANAFYSRRDEALLFGYFPGRRASTVFTCLSHDVVVHETTHALLDGLRSRFDEFSSPDQAAFHEGFADVVALLSVFRLPEVVALSVAEMQGRAGASIPARALTAERLAETALFGLAEQMGRESQAAQRAALRQSLRLDAEDVDLDSAEFAEPHRRGEGFVAAMMHAFIAVWAERLDWLADATSRSLSASQVAEEGTSAASHLLTMAIRAIDYTPPVDLQFGDYLSALLTSDSVMYPDGGKYNYRHAIESTLRLFGIVPPPTATPDGLWRPPEAQLSHDVVHFEAMQRDPDEVFRFIWENRAALKLDPDAYTYVESVRPALRVAPDGFTLRETVVEYVQILDIRASELGRWKLRRPDRMPMDQPIRLYGGGTLIFDEYGRLKFNIGSSVRSGKQQRRLDYLWESGSLIRMAPAGHRFARHHHMRAGVRAQAGPEAW